MNPARSQGQDPQAGDIYSLACIIYEVYTGSPPLFSTHKLLAVILLAVLVGERPELPPPGMWTADEEVMWWLVGHRWADKPQDRPNITLIKQALRDISIPKLATTDLPDAVSDDMIDFATDLHAVKVWLMNEAVAFAMILFNYLRNFPRSSFNVFKLGDGARLSNVQFGDKRHPSPHEHLFSRRHQTVAFRRSLKIEASRQAAETSAIPSSSQAFNGSSSLPTPPPTSKTDSLPTPLSSPGLSYKTHVVSASRLRPDAYVPPGASKVSSQPSGAIRTTAPQFVPTRHLQQNNCQL